MLVMGAAFLKEQCLGRIISGHPWIYSTDILRIEKAPENGEEIIVRTHEGAYVGNGFYNDKSRIPIRIFSRNKEKLDKTLFQKRIVAAKKMREDIFGSLPEAVRMVWSEADFLPGLIVDRYGETIVFQTLTLGMDQRKQIIVDVLKDVCGISSVIERNDVSSRQFEGLPLHKGVYGGENDSKKVLRLGKALMEVDFLEGQKTGTYLDQISNHIFVGELAKDRKVLDCFSYHGGFALHAGLAGAKQVIGLDISEPAIQRCQKNSELNALKNIKWKAVNVFDELHVLSRQTDKFDLIILDPPSFTKTRSKIGEAIRGYKEIHVRALKLLSPGGLLATFCCSHHIDAQTFRDIALDASFDTRKILRLRHSFTQSPDHPIIPAVPETEYLKGFLFEVVEC
jgi:23S rRNA (cytosine1962-C5)-methyltransferase